MDNKTKKWWEIDLKHKISLLIAIIGGLFAIGAAFISPFFLEKFKSEPPKFVISYPITQPDVGLTIELPSNASVNNDYLDVEFDGILFPKSAKYITGSAPPRYHFTLFNKDMTSSMLCDGVHKVRIRFVGKKFSEPLKIIFRDDKEKAISSENEHLTTITEISQPMPLRSKGKFLSVSDVHGMPNINIYKKGNWGFYGHSTIIPEYDSETINGYTVVIDHSTNLMWHQSGSDKEMTWGEINLWIKKINRSGYLGHHDWRLPTLEEAVTLIGSSSRINGNLCIGLVFNARQSMIWTCDRAGETTSNAWGVGFANGGYVDMFHITRNYAFVRPVRSVK